MEDKFIPYDEGLVLKELGFNEPCLGYWIKSAFLGYPTPTFDLVDKGVIEGGLNVNNHTKDSFSDFKTFVPTYQEIFSWFRREHNLHAEPIWDNCGKTYWFFSITDIGNVDFNENRHRYESPLMEDQDVKDGYPVVLKWEETYEEAELNCVRKLIDIVKNR